MRKSGFYWVKRSGRDWSVAEWDDGTGPFRQGWLIPGDWRCQDSYWEEIDERRIERAPIIERGCSDDYPIIDLKK